VPRERLANRRESLTFDVSVGGLDYRVTAGRYPDGRLAEVFLDGSKVASAADIAARDSAITASIAIQCGADVETIRRALCRNALGAPLGPLAAALDAIQGWGGGI
jgi:hypothetical protein